MNILLDITRLAAAVRYPSERTGIARVTHHVTAGLAKEPSCRVQVCASTPRLYAACQELIRTEPEFQTLTVARPPVIGNTAYKPLVRAADGLFEEPRPAGLKRVGKWAAFRAMRLLEGAYPPIAAADLRKADIFHSTFVELPSVTLRYPRVRRVLTIHDVIALRRPDFFDEAIVRHMKLILASLRPDDWVLAVSEATRRDLLSLRPDLRPEQVRVTPWAASEKFQVCDDPIALSAVRTKYGIPPDGRYLLALNTLEPRKNMEGTVRAFKQIVGRQGLEDVRLVLAGGKGWKFGPLMQLIEVLGPARDRLHCPGYIDDADLPALYSGAAAFVFPSHYEGFGLPPLEAMQCGTPVITSDNSSLPEVVGDAGLLVPSDQDEPLAAAMARVLKDESLRRDLSKKSLDRAAKFTWDRCIAETMSAYREALLC